MTYNPSRAKKGLGQMNISSDKLGVIIPLAVGTGVFWAVMLKQKNGPGDLFKRLRNNPHWLAYPVMILAFIFISLLFAVPIFFIDAPLLVKTGLAAFISITALVVQVVIAFATSIAISFKYFVRRVMECAACSPFWITLLTAPIVLFSDWSLIPLYIFGVTGLIYVALSFVGVNDLRDL